MENELVNAVAKLQATILDVEKRLNARFVGLEQKFVGLEQKFVGLEQKVAAMETRLMAEIMHNRNLYEMILDEIKPAWRQKAPLI